jgi:hypothetical protein
MEDFNYSNWKLRETQQRNRRLAPFSPKGALLH